MRGGGASRPPDRSTRGGASRDPDSRSTAPYPRPRGAGKLRFSGRALRAGGASNEPEFREGPLAPTSDAGRSDGPRARQLIGGAPPSLPPRAAPELMMPEPTGTTERVGTSGRMV